MCYKPSPATFANIIQRNVTIPNINTDSQNYTITVNLCYYISGSCQYNDIKDSESISFTTPLTSTLLETVNQNNEKPFTVFPNPVQDILYFQNIDTATAVEIYDTLGRKVLEQNQPGTTISVSGLEVGNYFLQIPSGGKITTQRFIKQ